MILLPYVLFKKNLITFLQMHQNFVPIQKQDQQIQI